jgi:hypothetical protein
MGIFVRLFLGCTLAALLVCPVHAGPQDRALDGILNATYLIEKQAVQLVSGRAEVQAAPGSVSKVTTEVFSKPTYGDLNGDGRDDAVLFLVQDPGGSGTFYYVAAAIAKNGLYQGTNAVLLGDRVFPRAIHIRNCVIVAEYEDRHPDQPMAARPSIGKTMYLKLNEGYLKAIKILGAMRNSTGRSCKKNS